MVWQMNPFRRRRRRGGVLAPEAKLRWTRCYGCKTLASSKRRLWEAFLGARSKQKHTNHRFRTLFYAFPRTGMLLPASNPAYRLTSHKCSAFLAPRDELRLVTPPLSPR